MPKRQKKLTKDEKIHKQLEAKAIARKEKRQGLRDKGGLVQSSTPGKPILTKK